ncbi:MAG: phosphate acyltransferase [Hyphomicrobiales bacterium]|nr:phosphate acyltransferase [Hyphomicrobiales bacterium]
MSVAFAPLLERARNKGPVCAIVAGAHDSNTLTSTIEARETGLIKPVLVGKRGLIEKLANEMRVDIEGVEIEDIGEEVDIARRVGELAGERENALAVKGLIHTDVLMRSLLSKEAGLRIGRRASHAFLIEIPGEPWLIISDAALNVEPKEEDLLDIARNALNLADSLDMDARVALLSASETPFQGLPSSMRAKNVFTKLVSENPDAAIAGPYALDIAISPEAAMRKGMKGEVAGHSNVLIVPNIETGNALYKWMVWRQGASAAGVILGLKVPVALTSRSDTPASRIGAIALALCASN